MKRLPVPHVISCLAVVALLHPAAAAGPNPFPVPAPLHIGVGGDYPDGLDGVLMTHGLPHERIFPWELADPVALKRYEVLLLSCPVATRGQLDPALRAWVEAGGRLYVEVWAGMRGPGPFADLVFVGGNTPLQADTLLSPSEHPILSGLDRKLPIDTFHLQGTFLRPLGPEARVLAQFVPDGGGAAYPYGVAAIAQPLGRGELVYTGSPLSFCCFHRGPTTEPLLMNMIDFLAGGRTVPRLTTGANEPEEEAGAAPPPGGMPGREDEGAGKLPPGLQLVEAGVDGPYNLTITIKPPPRPGSQAAVILLDAQLRAEGQLKRPALWLVLAPDRLTLRAGATMKSPTLASVKWQSPTQPTPLLIRRRAGAVSVVAGDRELLRAKTALVPAGTIASANGCVSLMQARVQPVEPPDFADDFMRDPGDPSPWTTVSGQWRVVGLGAEEQSVNGFYVRGSGTEEALTATGEAWWEDYTASVAARPDGDGSVGICALRQENGDRLAFVADSTRQASAALKLVQVRDAKETVLAQQPGGVAPGQWVRLTVRLKGGQVEGLLDDAPALQAPLAEARGGGIGLLVRGGSARFDDVLVQSATEALASPRHEGTPAADMPGSLGPQDTLTWANRAAAWEASAERPSLLWHAGHFGPTVTCSLRLETVPAPALRRLVLAPSATAPEAEWLTVTATMQPQAQQATVSLRAPGQAAVEKRVAGAAVGRLTLAREGDRVTVRWNKETLLQTACAQPLPCVGLEVMGPAVAVEAVTVRGPQVRDYMFGVAPVDWQASAGTWEVASRWACDKRWSWFAGWGTGDFAVWNKHRAEGDVALDYTVGIKMEAPGGAETTRCRDLNAVLCGDGANPRSGYSFILGGDGGLKTQLLRRGVVVAEAPDMRVPGGYGIHHEWFRVRVARVGSRVEADFEGRPVFRYNDPEPLPGGFVGLWSRDNGILVPRVTVYQ